MAKLRKDQHVALWAYQKAESAKNVNDYDIAVQTFAAALVRNGLEVAASVLERRRDRDGKNEFALLLKHLASEPLPGVPAGTEPREWASRVREMTDVSQYMLASREMRTRITWLRRACRALRPESDDGNGGQDANRSA